MATKFTFPVAGGRKGATDLFQGRYKIAGELGRGASAIVFEASDLIAERSVALKILIGPRDRQLFSEYRRLAALSHDNLVNVYSLERLSRPYPLDDDVTLPQGAPMVVLEYVEGTDPLQAFTEVAPEARDLRLRQIARDLSSGLDAIHRAGIIHRDLKPDNVLIESASGRAVIIDFGLAVEQGSELARGGTLPYMSPEALAGIGMDHRVDLYALGATLFHVAMGQPPFVGSSEEIIRSIVVAAPKLDATWLRNGTRDLILALLAKDAQQRPSSAHAVLAELARLSGDHERVASLMETRPLVRSAFVGRRQQRKELSQHFDQTQGLQVIVVDGNPGVGKSRLIDVALSDHRMSATLRQVLPLAVHKFAPGDLQRKASDEQVIAACEHIELAAAGRAMLVHFDNVEADDLQQRIVEGLIQTHALVQQRVDLCLVVELQNAEAWRDRLKILLGWQTIDKALHVQPLSAQEVEEMVASMAGDVEPEKRRRVVGAALGNPRVVEELLFHGTEDLGKASPSLLQLMRGRRRDMGPNCIILLDTLALAGEALDEQALVETTGISQDLLQEAIADLLSGGLLTATTGGRFYVASKAQTKAWRSCITDVDAKRTLHRALAKHYAQGGEELDSQIKQALHLGLGQQKAALPLLLKVGRAALDCHQPQQVVGVFRALRAFIDGANSESIRHLEAEILVESGRYADALALLSESDPHTATLRAKAWIRQGELSKAEDMLSTEDGDYETLALRGQICLRKGNPEQAWNVVSLAIERASCEGEEKDAAGVIEVGGLSYFYRGELDHADRLFTKVHEVLAKSGERSALTARFCNLRGMVAFAAGRLSQASDYYTVAAELAEKSASKHALALYRGNLGGVALELGNYRSALICLTKACTDLGRMGRSSDLVSVLCNLATVYVRLGDLQLGEKLRAESVLLAEKVDSQQALAYLHFLAGDIALRQGKPRSAATNYSDALQLFRRLGAKREQGLALLALGKAWVYCGEFHQVSEALKDDALVQFSPRETAELRALMVLEAPPFFVDEERACVVRDLVGRCQYLEDAGMLGELWRASCLLAKLLMSAGRSREAAIDALKLARRNWLLLMREVPELFEENMRDDPQAKEMAEHWKSLLGDEPSSVNPKDRVDPRIRRLLAINKRLNSELRLPRLLELIIDTVIELSEAERGFLLLFEEDGSLAVKVARNIDQEALASEELQLSRSIAERAAKSGEPVITVDAVDDGRFSSAISVDDLSLRSVLAVPLTVKGKSVGTIYVDHRLRKGLFGEEELALLMDLAQQAAIAIENARLLGENQRRQEEIEALNRKLADKVEQQEQALLQAQEEIRSNRQVLKLRYEYSNIVGRTTPMLELFSLLDRVTDSELPVVLQGESGTGKELVARAIHYNGARASAPFVGENCGAIPESLLESVLFGHMRGSFTGANRDRKGLFAVADGGTLFLDEVGEMSPGMQTKLLRVLQGGDFRPVGSEVTRRTDVRVIAASNRDLREEVRAGRFREDLFYRINVVNLEIPPLRKRREDIPSLVAHFLEKHAAGKGRTVGKDAMALLMGYGWPGNVRELENEVMRLCALAGATIGVADLSPHIGTGPALFLQDPADLALKPRVEHLERELIERALEQSGNNHSHSAKLLGLSRYGLLKKLRRYYPDKYKAKAGVS